MKTLTCIVCPRGCILEITGTPETQDLQVYGNQCPRVARYGLQEVTAPVRVVTSTVRVPNGALARCPVKIAGEVPKSQLLMSWPHSMARHSKLLSSEARSSSLTFVELGWTG